MELLNDPLLMFWRLFGDWGFALVIGGVIGEVVFASIEERLGQHEEVISPGTKKWKDRLKRYETLAGWVLIIGLAMEFGGHIRETTILDSSNVTLYGDAKRAERQAGRAYERAAKFDSDRVTVEKEAEQIRQTNFILQVKLLELENRTAQRTITPENREKFIKYLSSAPKGTVLIYMNTSGGSEIEKYAQRIREMVYAAGYFGNGVNIEGGRPMMEGINIGIRDTNSQPPFAGPIQRAFKEIGIDANGYIAPKSEIDTNSVIVYVGSKPE
jgi:hypothetical protein